MSTDVKHNKSSDPNWTFDDSGNSSNHRRKHSIDKRFKCEQCEYRSNWKNCIARHFDQVHKKLRPHKCEMSSCDKAFARKHKLLCHRQTHTGEKPFKCEQCEYRSNQKAAVNRHVSRVHLKLRLHKCDICDKTFAESWNLSDHRRTHTGERPFGCGQCSYRGIKKGDLAGHVRRVHEKLRPHRCDVCDKTFARSYHLLNHYRTHSAEKPFKCEQCEFRTNRKDRVATHVKQVHEKPPPYKKPRRIYKCEVCDKVFSSTSHLSDHRRTHSSERPFECAQCSFRSKVKGSLAKHVKQVHEKLRPYRCHVCNKTFGRNEHLLNHRGMHVGVFGCEQCDYRCNQNYRLRLHVKLKHDKSPPYKSSRSNLATRQTHHESGTDWKEQKVAHYESGQESVVSDERSNENPFEPEQRVEVKVETNEEQDGEDMMSEGDEELMNVMDIKLEVKQEFDDFFCG